MVNIEVVHIISGKWDAKEGRKKNPTNEDSMKPIDLDKKNMSDDEIYAQSLRNSLLQANPKGRLPKTRSIQSGSEAWCVW